MEFMRQFYTDDSQTFFQALEMYLEGKFYDQTSKLLFYEVARIIFKSNEYMRPQKETVDQIHEIRNNLRFFKHGILTELSKEITRTIKDSVVKNESFITTGSECNMQAFEEQTMADIFNSFDYTRCEASMGQTLYTKIRDGDWIYERIPIYGELPYEDFARSMDKISKACAHELNATPAKVVVQELVDLLESRLSVMKEIAWKQMCDRRVDDLLDSKLEERQQQERCMLWSY